MTKLSSTRTRPHPPCEPCQSAGKWKGSTLSGRTCSDKGCGPRVANKWSQVSAIGMLNACNYLSTYRIILVHTNMALKKCEEHGRAVSTEVLHLHASHMDHQLLKLLKLGKVLEKSASAAILLWSACQADAQLGTRGQWPFI